MKPKNGAEPSVQSPTISLPPSDSATVAERGREIADLLLRGLQEGVLTEQEQERRQNRAMRTAQSEEANTSRKESPHAVEL